MDRNAHRNIKKAESNGITVKINQNHEEFYNMYMDHIKSKKHIKWYDIASSESIKKYGTLFTAEKDSKILSGGVFLEDEDNIVYLIASSYRYSPDKETRTSVGNATYMIQWEVIKYAKAKGIKEYNLGPCMSEEQSIDTLVQFKKGLGCKETIHYNYYKDYNNLLKIVRFIYRYIR